jgi:hypothetical protein
VTPAVGAAAQVIEGVVHWRRDNAPPTRGGAANEASFRVRVLPQYHERLSYLLSAAIERPRERRRESGRYLCSLPAILGLTEARRTTLRFIHGTLQDVSEGGALLVCAIGLREGQVLPFGVVSRERIECQARVCWTHGDRAGLQLVAPSPSVSDRWRKLVDSLASSGQAIEDQRSP